jgi:hypothetical protein
MYRGGGSMSSRTRRNELFGESKPEFGSRFSNIANEESQAMMESQNDAQLENLRGKLSTLKGLSMDIQREVQSQNSFLDNMGLDMSNTNNMLSQTMGQLNNMISKGGGGHMCTLICFSLFVFFCLWWLIRF